MSEQGFKVLLLSSDFGEGHQQVAEAIKTVLGAHHPNITCRIVNIVAHLHPRLHPISRSVFLHAVKKIPSLYGYLYRKTYGGTISSHFLSELSSFGLKRLETLLQEEQPSVVVSTFPFASGAMAILRKQGATHVPLVTVITDQTVHHSWVHAPTDLYLVGSEPVKQGLIKRGVPASAIQVTGIPLRPAFANTYSKHHLRMVHHLSPTMPTVLILGGGFGLFGEEMFDRDLLEKLPFRLQLVVICGHNKKARALVERELKGSRHHVQIKGFVDNMQEWMAMSDLILTKPGGVTTAEAMALEVPMLLYKPIPGQEEENLRFLVASGVAEYASSGDQLLKKMCLLLQAHSQLTQMQRCARQVGHKNSTQRAVTHILQLVDHKVEADLLPV